MVAKTRKEYIIDRYLKEGTIVRLVRVIPTDDGGNWTEKDKELQLLVSRVGRIVQRERRDFVRGSLRTMLSVAHMDPTEDNAGCYVYCYSRELRRTHPQALRTQRLIDRLTR